MKVPLSNMVSNLAWDTSVPDYPTLIGSLAVGGNKVEIALIGSRNMNFPWGSFLNRVEDRCANIEKESYLILESAKEDILNLHRLYFQDKWTGNAYELLHELHLRQVCFYLDESSHFWYQGSGVFNALDVDIGLDPIGEISEVRFDG